MTKAMELDFIKVKELSKLDNSGLIQATLNP
jgi:phage antirepressor YoqD-like protein